MFKNAFRLPFRLLGIPLYLDVTFLIILPLFAWIIAGQIPAFVELLNLPVATEALTVGAVPYLLGLAAALGLFVSVVIHELGHAVTARRYNVETERITLWLLGGVAQLTDMPRQRGAEAVVGIAGPITSFALALLGWGLLQLIPPGWAAAYFVVAYVTYMNVALAVFNMLPALPLDGGRVLRSLLALRMDRLQATRVAARISRVLAVALGLFGLLSFNIFLMFIAFFIYVAVAAETQHTIMGQIFEGVQVEELMTQRVAWVSPEMSCGELKDKMFREGHLGYPVLADTGQLIGMITLNELRLAPPRAPVGAVMTRDFATIARTAKVFDAFELMTRNNFGRLIVVDEQTRVVGILTKTDLMRAVQVGIVGQRLNEQAV
ncbi:MAG: site-2 protease family protein [Bradymonadaceae bacterium]|nr:site-2 protease family protein [Lujinxingiaceae bacterium]